MAHPRLSREEELEDAIRDMLDFAIGYCKPMALEERLAMIYSIGSRVPSSPAIPTND